MTKNQELLIHAQQTLINKDTRDKFIIALFEEYCEHIAFVTTFSKEQVMEKIIDKAFK